MYESIIKRLRDKQKAHMPCGYELCGEAADAIEQLQNERDKAFEHWCRRWAKDHTFDEETSDGRT